MLHKSQEDRLRWELKMLHELLEDVEGVNTETRDAMRLLADDIHRLLGEQAEDKSNEDDWSDVGRRWRDAVLDFESHHPRLTQTVDQVTGLLANAGI